MSESGLPSFPCDAPSAVWRLARALVLATSVAGAAMAEEAPLRVAVYDAPPYGHLETDGSISVVSVELWRRTAEMLGREYRLIPVGEMKAVIDGVARNDYDAAIGAITITPERLAKVDFSYPAHRSGVAVAVRKDSGSLAAFAAYAAVVAELGPLIAITLGLLVAMGVAMWIAERPMRSTRHDSAVASLRDGVYWAVVTMTTVGYGDKTPKTNSGRAIAILRMLTSVALVSILSTAIVSRMTVERLSSARRLTEADLIGRRLAAVANSSGAEFLDDAQARLRAVRQPGRGADRARARSGGCGRQQRRGAAIRGHGPVQPNDRAAQGRARARLYGDRAPARQPAEEAARPGPDRNHGEPRMAPDRGELF